MGAQDRASTETMTGSGIEPAHDRVRLGRSYAVLVAVLLASRLAYFAVGVRLGTGTLKSAIQLLPEHLLQHDLWRSLWYLHAQPPGFNAFVGFMLQVPVSHVWVFRTAYLGMGIALACTMFALMLELSVPRRLALLATMAFVVSPITVLYEDWLYYSYPVALMLCVAALCFARFVRTNRIAYAVGFGGTLSLLALTRASYHLVAVLGAGAFVVFLCPRPLRKRALVAVVLPLALVGGLYVKNTIQFGAPTSSTWFGMNLAHMVFSHDPPELRADIAANRVSRDALIVPFVPLSRYKNVTLPHTGVPALDLVDDAGHANFNNQAYIGISNQDLKDVLRFVARHPNVYLRKVGGAYRLASTSAADYAAFRTNRPHIAPSSGSRTGSWVRLTILYRPRPAVPNPVGAKSRGSSCSSTQP